MCAFALPAHYNEQKTNSQSITLSDCHAAVCQPDDLQECWWIQKVVKSGLVWSRTSLTLLSTTGETISVGRWKTDNWMICQPKWQKCVILV